LDFSLNFYVVDQTINPSAAPPSPVAVGPATSRVGPHDAAVFLEGHPRLAVSGTGAVGGRYPGTKVSFTVKDGYPYASSGGECSRTRCVLLFRHMGTRKIVAAYEGDANHFYLLPVNGALVLASVAG